MERKLRSKQTQPLESWIETIVGIAFQVAVASRTNISGRSIKVRFTHALNPTLLTVCIHPRHCESDACLGTKLHLIPSLAFTHPSADTTLQKSCILCPIKHSPHNHPTTIADQPHIHHRISKKSITHPSHIHHMIHQTHITQSSHHHLTIQIIH